MICECCKRDCVDITRHHLIPRTRHNNKKVKKNFTRAQLNETVNLCRSCHKQIHALFPDKALESKYYTLATFATHPVMVEFINWIKNKPADVQPRVKRSY